MKTIVTVISSLVMGALFANSSFSPLQEVQHWLMNKRRFFYALGFYAAGFVFLMTGIISGTIEATLQYEAQGFVFWSAMSSLALGFAGAGLIFMIAGKLITPRFLPQMSSFSAFGSNTDWSQILEGAVRIFSEMTTPAPTAHRDPRKKQPEEEREMSPPTPPAATEQPFEMHH